MNSHTSPAAITTHPAYLPNYLTQEQLAAKFQKDVRTIWDWRRRGLIPFVKLGGAVLFDPAAVAKALERFTVNASE